MNLQYRYILSLSKKENMFYEKTKTKQKDLKKKKSFPRRESNPEPPTYKVNALSIPPQQLQLKTFVKLIIF